MGCITAFLFLLNALAWIAFDAVCWYLTGTTLGWIGLTGAIVFLISWNLSNEVKIAEYERFMNTPWKIIVVRLTWSNKAAVIAMGLTALVSVILDWYMHEFAGLEFSIRVLS
ncbi:hypothetical protein FACS1894162_0130 [Bacteroidia bacterium]|nr:hypothetical protein FACS1894162_0130 [Bacteroidia bacterium]